MFLRKKMRIAFWCELEPEIHVKLEQKGKPPIVMTKHTHASGRQTQALLGRAYFSSVVVLVQNKHYHKLPPTTTKPSSRLHISLPSTQPIPSHPKSPLSHLQQQLHSLRTIRFLHTHTHTRETKGCARCHRIQQQ